MSHDQDSLSRNQSVEISDLVSFLALFQQAGYTRIELRDALVYRSDGSVSVLRHHIHKDLSSS